MLITAFLLALQPAPQETPAPQEPSSASPQVEITPVPLTLEQQANLRCAASLAVTAARQKDGDAQALAYPELGDRGKEFFVRTLARLMDETGMERLAVRWHLTEESRYLQEGDNLDRLMPVCLTMLEASGL